MSLLTVERHILLPYSCEVMTNNYVSGESGCVTTHDFVTVEKSLNVSNFFNSFGQRVGQLRKVSFFIILKLSNFIQF